MNWSGLFFFSQKTLGNLKFHQEKFQRLMFISK
jgi:hypothetical protein